MPDVVTVCPVNADRVELPWIALIEVTAISSFRIVPVPVPPPLAIVAPPLGLEIVN
jgi:hypothetical protein